MRSISSSGCRTVVSFGVVAWARSTSSKPVTDRSSGTRRPAAAMMPTATLSLKPTATASPAGESPAAAVDGDASTRWSSGQAQQPGQYLQVDLGPTGAFRQVAIDSGGNLGDYARGWQLAVSDDATSWRTVASGAGTGQLTTVDLPRTRARYLRITSTGSAGNWWSISDIRLYS
jgi:hypothetical protein